MHLLLNLRTLGKSTLIALRVAFIFSISLSFGQEQIGRPMITNYSYQDYGAEPINWWAIEDDEGIMYFANGDGVLQFDGVNWNLIETDYGARSFVRDDKGTIYVGCESDFGYLAPNEKGELKYISLKDKVPEADRNFNTVWEVDFFEGRVLFRTNNKIFCWDGENMKVISSEDAFHVGKIVHGVYYVRIWNRGLCYLTKDDTFEVVPGGERFANERIYTILPYDDQQILLGSRSEGFYIFDGTTYKPFKTEIDEFVKEALYLPGLALENGNFVINTFNDGTYLMDHEGKLIQKYTTDNGLQDGSTSYTYLDSRGVLWMPLFNGVSKVNLNSSITLIDSNMGLPTKVVFASYRFKGVLYLSTNNGIFYLDEAAKEVRMIEGTSGQGSNFLEKDGRLYIGTGFMGTIEIIDKTFTYVRKSENYDFRTYFLHLSKIDPNRMYAVTNDGLGSFYFDPAKDKFEQESYTDDYISRTVIERPDGAIWFPSENDGEIKLLIPNIVDHKLDLKNSEVLVYDKEKGVPEKEFGFYDIQGEMVIFDGGNKKTLVYNTEKDLFEEKKLFFDDLIVWNNSDGGTGDFKDSQGRIWFGLGEGIIIAEKNNNGSYTFNQETFKELKNRRIWNIYAEPNKPGEKTVAWLSGPDGVVRYEGHLEKPSSTNFKVHLRRMSIANDSLIYAGGIDFPESLKISNEFNTVTMNYAAPLFIAQKDMLYSTFLEGFDNTWVDWSKQASREYINLPAGNYKPI